MKVPAPFLPVRITTEGRAHTVSVLNRAYTFGANGMLASIQSQGVELLAAPMRIVLREDGEEARWDCDYEQNESECFIQKRADDEAVLCGAMQSERFIVDTCYKIGYDGNVAIDLKLMTRGKTVAQEFGIAAFRALRYQLDRLWVEIPLRAENCPLYQMYPCTEVRLSNGECIAPAPTATSGRVPRADASMPFKCLLWLGDDERGLGYFAETDRHWQPERAEEAVQLVHNGDELVLRLRLLDGQPLRWQGDTTQGNLLFHPVSFHFGLQATPVKPMPNDRYVHRALHLDCGIKIKGNYGAFLAQENRFDRLREKGVTTLILHEKWNKSQNWFELSEYTQQQLTYICDECHKRGIKVLPYFGYECASMGPEWSELQESATVRDENNRMIGGWWRVPFQRDYVVCYHSSYQDRFIEGVARIMDTCHIDGVYLDGTSWPRCCYNTAHGCGWYDEEGRLHGTYTVQAVRRHFQRLYDVVKSRGGQINVHCFGFVNFTAAPYIDQHWMGENLQFAYMKGCFGEQLNLDYFRAEYGGANIGVPVEFLAYENRPLWNFEDALSIALVHGMLPRPNDIEHPLDVMSEVWGILDRFPYREAEWRPYWSNGFACDHPQVKASYYRYTALNGETSLLVFVANLSQTPVEQATITLPERFASVMDARTRQEASLTLSLGRFENRILYLW